MSWTEHGPVSLPPRPVAYFAGAILIAAAIVGVGLGVHAGWRNDRPALGSSDQSSGVDGAIPARPLVELPPPPQQEAAANTASNATDSQDQAEDSNTIDVQTAAAQEVQSKPSKSNANIDDILTSSTEKPQAPAKPSTDESAPPGKSDVPF